MTTTAKSIESFPWYTISWTLLWFKILFGNYRVSARYANITFQLTPVVPLRVLQFLV
jgi:hypothetical protein